MITDVVIGDIGTNANSEISRLVTKLNASWTLDAVSQVTIDIHDPKMQMLRANYFQIRRPVTYRGTVFEISSVEVGQGAGEAQRVKIECRTRAIQQMKRNKNPASYGGVSATDYARLAANDVGLGFVGEPTEVKRSIVAAKAGDDPDKAETVWAVIQRLAGEAKFVAFESDNILYFCSEQWLLGRWANLTLRYPSPNTEPFIVLETPTCRSSDDDVRAAEATISLHANNAVNLRPGMTVALSGVGPFDVRYLVSEVSYDVGEGAPVGVSMRTPRKQE